MEIQERVKQYLEGGKTRAEAINLAYSDHYGEIQKMQEGGNISQFKKKPFQLQNEAKQVQRDNTPNTKRDLSLMMSEYNNINKDEKELRATGQVKAPSSIQYRKNIKPQAEIRQENISAEQRNAQLSPLERPLIYLANPSKLLGDIGVPNMETSELDRQAIVANRFNPNQTRTQRLENQVKLGLGYVPEATVNTAMAATFMPEGSGALGLINETLNPLAGIKTSIPDSMKEGLNSQGFLDMFKSKPKSEINWGKWNKEIAENPQLIKEYNAIEQTSKANNTWMKNPDGSKFEGIPEEFVKVNSQNFKNAYPNGYRTTYRGQKEASDIISGGTRGYNSSVFTGDLEQAKTYANNWKEPIYKKGITTSSDEGGTSLNKLIFPQTDESSILKINAKGANWDKIENTEVWNSLPEYERNFRTEEGNFNVTTDDIAKYMENRGYNRAEIKNVVDNGGGVSKKILGKDKTSNTVINNNIQGNYLKSILGNNGMFDMNNPNIYKSIAPIVGASYLATQGQHPFQQGGEVKYTEKELNFLKEFAQLK